jgi:hypothetical protein
MLMLQRQAGNAAVGALMAAKLKSPGEQAGTGIDAALKEIRKNDPAIGTVEKGLKAASAAGVPVELEGPKPPASALAVTKTGFGPGSVPAKKPVQPPKPLPAVSPLGKAAAAKMKVPAKGSARGKPPAAGPGGGGVGPALLAPLALPADKLLQPPVAPVTVRPEDDPGFAQVAGSIKGVAQSRKAHPPAAAKAQEAQGAALPPTDDVAGQAKAAKVDAMDAQQPGTFDKQTFIAAVKAAIEAKSPKTLEEADEYKKSGKAGEAKGQVQGLVGQGKAGQAKDIEAATAAPPDQSKAVPKPVTPMAQEQAGQVSAVPAAGAAPKPAPADQLNLAAGPQQANQEMADADVSEQQLAQSNEPEFQQGLADKKAAAEHAQTAPAEYRQQEQHVLQQGKAEAGTETAAGVAGMQNAKASALANLVANKGKAKSKDETRRAEVTAKVQAIFAATEAEVKKTLDGIDPAVEEEFTTGEAGARSAFEAYVEAKMSAYKKDRYGGWLGGYRWLRDKIAGMPPKVNEFYEAGRELYLAKMNVVISRVADIVGRALTAAKQRIAKGRSEISTYVTGLPTDLQKVGAEATKEIGDRFEALEGEVNAKQESVVDALAAKYVEAGKGLNDRIEALQAENKGLVDKAIGALKAIINTIRELAGMLKNVLSRAAGVVGDIIKNPVAFLGNLIEGVKGGILKFKDNILAHLKKGLMGWLFGALAEGGVELPDTFDLKGIIKLLASIFGLTWANIRNRLVKHIGEPAMAAVEKGVEIFQVIASQGVAGLWQMLLDKLGNIKDMILEQVKDFVITKIITAGITWLIGLLNPAAAFIKACKLIYDVVMFFVNNAERIMKFVNTIIDSVADIVRGNVSAVVNKIEDVLGQMVPILIGFLASVIGIGGIGQKIRQIIETLQKPVNKALDFVIKTGLKLAGPIIRGIKGFAGKVKGKIAAGKAWVKGKAEAGKAWVKGKTSRGTGLKQTKRGEEPSPSQMARAARNAAKDGHSAIARGISPDEAPQVLAAVLDRHRESGVKALDLVAESDGLHVMASVNPTHVWRDGVRITISPIVIREISGGEKHQVGALESEDLLSSRQTTARGYFLYDGKGHAVEAMTSSESTHYRRNATRSAEGAHAEEQLTNAFEIIYDDVLGQRARKHNGVSPSKYSIELGIDVSVSSCPNCANHIASFVRRMLSDGCNVQATMRFGGLYHGPSKDGPTKGRIIMPTVIAPDDQALLAMFYRRGEVRSVKKGRTWGALTMSMEPRTSPSGYQSLPSGQRVGKLGLAILSSAGVKIEVLTSNDLRAPSTSEGNVRIEQKAEKLKKALAAVEEKLGKNAKAT